MHIGKRSFPGRRTLEEWLAMPYRERIAWVWRAQADLFGTFRFCTDQRCRRHRMCCGRNDPEACRKTGWRSRKVVPKTLWNESARINRLSNLPYWPNTDQDRPREEP
jgi:hypothetical protein